jgi:predicted DNA-binding transcriptional regulator YafY
VGNDAKLARCIRLLSGFHARGELATRDVMRLLDCDRQRAMRDLRSLEEAGVPLEVRGEGAHRRYVLPETYRRKGLVLTVGDALALSFGRQLLGFLEGTTLSVWLDGLLEKLAPAVSGPAAETGANLGGRLVYLSEPYRRYESYDDLLNELLTAIVRNQELAIDYAAPEVHHYEPAQPLALVIYRRALYLLTRAPGHERPLRLALERIVRVRRLATHFSLPRG